MTVFDTNILIYFLEHHPTLYKTARRALEKAISSDGFFAYSALSVSEVLRGPSPQSDIVDFFKQPQVMILPLTDEIAYLSGQISQAKGLKTPDAVIVATALYQPDAHLVTNDMKLLKLDLGLGVSSLKTFGSA